MQGPKLTGPYRQWSQAEPSDLHNHEECGDFPDNAAIKSTFCFVKLVR